MDSIDDENIIFDETKKKEKKAASVRANYYNLPEEELQILIEKSKQGHNRSQEELLKVFNNFILKYTALLYKNKYDLHDYDLRLFISLFVTDRDTIIRLKRNKINHKTFKVVVETLRGINYMIKRYCQEEDVHQTVQMTFLQCVSRYKRTGAIPFSGYLYSYFYFLLKKNVDNFLIYQLGRKTFPLYTDDSVTSSFPTEGQENGARFPSMQDIFVSPAAPSVEDLVGNEEIDEYWVIGEKALFPFDRLTIQQRQLLKWRYVDRLKASQIAIKTTEHPNTCRSQLQEIKEEIRQILEEEFTI